MSLTFDPADHDRVLPLAQAVAAATREESGCSAYTVWVDPTSKGRYHAFEAWVDTAALVAHEATPHIAEFLRALADLRVRSIEFARYEVTNKRDLF